MLSSPLRTCIITKAILPKGTVTVLQRNQKSFINTFIDLLIRFGGALDPDTGKRYLLPNGVEHPKYVKTVGGTNFWVSCRKEAVKHSIANSEWYTKTPVHKLTMAQKSMPY